jgi:hypothetical protein
MHKFLLFREYKGEPVKESEKVLCFNTRKKVSAFEYSSTKISIVKYEDRYILLVARGGELEIAIRNMKLDVSKLFVYIYNNNKKYIENIKKLHPKITIINSEDAPKVSLEITEVGFKWENYDNISLPKQDKDPKRNKPTIG